MMKQLSFWPWVLRTEPPVLMSHARNVKVAERENYLLEYQGLSQAGSVGRALERLVHISRGLRGSEIVPIDMYYNILSREYFRVPPSSSDKHKYDGSRNALISQQLSLPLLEYCTCQNQRAPIGRYGVAQECIGAGCCVALPLE